MQACKQKSDELFHDYYNPLWNVIKGNFGLPSNIDSTQVALNSMFTNVLLNWDLSLQVKRTRMKWEKMYTLCYLNETSVFFQSVHFSPHLDQRKKSKN